MPKGVPGEVLEGLNSWGNRAGNWDRSPKMGKSGQGNHFWFVFGVWVKGGQKLHVVGTFLWILKFSGSKNDQGADVFSRAFWSFFLIKNDQFGQNWSF